MYASLVVLNSKVSELPYIRKEIKTILLHSIELWIQSVRRCLTATNGDALFTAVSYT